MALSEQQLEDELIDKLRGLKYEYRADIRDRAALESNFCEKFQVPNQVKLTDGEFQRLHDEIVNSDVFAAAHRLRNRSSFTRDDGTPLNFTLVNIQDWCKNTFEVVSQLRINADNGMPVTPVEQSTFDLKKTVAPVAGTRRVRSFKLFWRD